MRKNLRTLILGAAAGLAVAGLAAAAILASKPAPAPQKVSIAAFLGPDTSLLLVATERGYFRQEGLDLTMVPFPSGRGALASLLKGNEQLATVATMPVVLAILDGQTDLTIVGTIFSSDTTQAVVARRDAGMSAPVDLAGKRIGLTRGTSAAYYLDALLTVERLPAASVSEIEYAPDRLEDALLAGEVDAVVAWEPILSSIQRRLGTNGITMNPKGLYTQRFHVVAAKTFAAKNPSVTVAFLRALARAEAYIRLNPDESRRIVGKIARWDDEILRTLWESYSFHLRLDQTILNKLESEGRWAIAKNLTRSRELPNFQNFIYLPGMQTVEPHRVTIRP
jgi:NitT/TauT family transport system substrate-binding protein